MATFNGFRVADERQTAFIYGASQDVTIGVGSLASAAFGANTFAIRIVSTSACRVKLGAAPTALATSSLLPANWSEVLLVNPGDKIAVIQEAAAGKLNITELS